jgi:hypothetical protein
LWWQHKGLLLLLLLLLPCIGLVARQASGEGKLLLLPLPLPLSSMLTWLQVALTPMNLGLNPQSLHSVFPIALYEGKESREALTPVLQPLNQPMQQLHATTS